MKKQPEMVAKGPNSKVVSFESNRSIVNPPERKLAKSTSVQWVKILSEKKLKRLGLSVQGMYKIYKF